jgi:hypothetical protein
MRRKWLVVGGVAIILLLLILLTMTLFNRSAKGTACEQIVQSIVDYDSAASYGLLSNDLRKEVSKEDWQEKVRGLYILFAATKEIKMDSRSETVDPATQTPVIRENYTVKTETGTLRPTCFLNEAGEVTGFIEN